MTAHTAYLTFETPERREFVRITDDVRAAVAESGIREGMVLVSAMHITAGVWVNDDEPGIQADTLEWLDKIAPPSWSEPANDVARQLPPDPGDYRHHAGGATQPHGEEVASPERAAAEAWVLRVRPLPRLPHRSLLRPSSSRHKP